MQLVLLLLVNKTGLFMMFIKWQYILSVHKEMGFRLLAISYNIINDSLAAEE